jgi:hypothetical protein
VNISRDSDSLKKGEQDTKVWKISWITGLIQLRVQSL